MQNQKFPTSPALEPVLTVSAVNANARACIEERFPTLWVEGELSNFTRARSGHLYFTLKDNSAQLRACMFRPRSDWLRFTPREGMSLLARGRLSLYEARGDFQFIAEHLEPAGEGQLRLEFEALRAKLAAEGLFDQQRKKELPEIPRRIGIITSPQGAAIHDVLSVIERRFPAVEVIILASEVQGAGAPASLLLAVERAIALHADEPLDILCLTRGGGSLEDLWAFNDERLARRVAACPIPTVSAIGHETDISILDFVVDQRAPTPSVAAEIMTPDRELILRGLDRHDAALTRCIQRFLQDREQRLDFGLRALQRSGPLQQLSEKTRLSERLRTSLHLSIRRRLEEDERRFSAISRQLRRCHPRHAISEAETRLHNCQARLSRVMRQRLSEQQQTLENLAKQLQALGPQQVLERGYSLSFDAEGKLIRDAEELPTGATVTTRLARNSFRSTKL